MPKWAVMHLKPDMTQGQNNEKIVWVKNDSIIRPQPVKTGLDDDINVQITQGLKPGDEVILSMEENKAKNTTSTAVRNPFMPHPPGRR